ncbi:F0F1 ATP synthase subunit delta [Campylobacter sputorum]|uniref:F0F1 ATP synthase subunit delta n=1 Tax=Campylobacter sputorum TaxID=206 RepID=UPI00053BEADD|nr:F0F1 ATP synthase subunit delta [Campylobacter sputorum]
MSNQVSKKYVKAILSEFENEELDYVISALNDIKSAFFIEKFNYVVTSPILNSSQKADFILSLVDNPNSKFINFIKLLSENKRLTIIPSIAKELNHANALSKKMYKGVVYTKSNLLDEQKKLLEDSFSKKFNAKVVFDFYTNDFNGIKISIPDLGAEINFSIDRLKDMMSEYILKAI